MTYRLDVRAHIHSCRTVMVDDSHITHGFNIVDLRAESSVWAHFRVPTFIGVTIICHCNLQPNDDISNNAQPEIVGSFQNSTIKNLIHKVNVI